MIDNKLNKSLIIVVILLIGLSISTFALIYSRTSVNNNTFVTGGVEININDGKPIIQENEYLFEPGMTVKKDFFIVNNSSTSVYYKLYFDNVVGDLKDVLEVTIKDEDGKTLYSSIMSKMNEKDVKAYDDVLQVNQRKNLSIYFYYPSSNGNKTQGSSLSFNLCLKATQTKNNTERKFN